MCVLADDLNAQKIVTTSSSHPCHAALDEAHNALGSDSAVAFYIAAAEDSNIPEGAENMDYLTHHISRKEISM